MIKNKVPIFFFIMFLPIYFTSSGLFIAEVNSYGLHLGERGLVFPLISMVGLLITFIIIFAWIKNREIKKIVLLNEISNIFGIILILFTLFASLNLFIYAEQESIIKLMQFVSGGLGIAISIYLFHYKKIDIITFFGKLGYFFLLISLLHTITSVFVFNFSIFSGELYPSILGWGIYQSRVYYPFIVSMIVTSSLPYIFRKNNILGFIYILWFLYYIYLLQVRGAFISYSLVLLLILIFIVQTKYKYIFISLIIILFISTPFFEVDTNDLGRLGNIDDYSDFNGRLSIWIEKLNINSAFEFWFGNLLGDPDGFSAHNQYIEFFSLAGIGALTMLLYIFIISWKLFANSRVMNNKSLKIFSLILFTHLIVDLNVNVPLSTTNPAIHYWFFWSSYYIYFCSTIRRY